MLISCSQSAPPAMKFSDWDTFKGRFVTSEGRVIDNAQSHVTHSESQAYGMLFSVAFNDRETFESIWKWTKLHLQVRSGDRMLAWLWDPKTGKVADLNNASDGDIVAAWALIRASETWQSQAYADEARQILESVKSLLVHMRGLDMLLPGSEGFESQGFVTVNPSYWIFPAYRAFAAFDPQGPWLKLERDASALLAEARYGIWHLPPDWLDVSELGINVSAQRPAWFSYDAIRVPLFMSWAGIHQPARDFTAFWHTFGSLSLVPDRVELHNDFIHFDTIFRAGSQIDRLCRYALDATDGPETYPQVQWHADTSYFDASLMMMSQMAWLELDAINKIHHRQVAN
ncbi:MAG: hypothetical protein CO186_08340 [Zetaproteobacteria bacterium CG_4_9_14_3_um_filter_49_83]|nr:MAG: hypothetical protein AUJ56_01010 [Zetaproteobacteria bacterium CG1_02_49_23]PIV29564.1 MAG: hypothetical protein COS35_11370 [Zetaproteobacteria bacterium CG02_land_8_20_14_3_00_50_9]PIY55239.1 MAG: hypothetical protein COZ00_10530 [Zetaproteobacteria bacterium CG_4_10_14_0_8_um_filter_49_80]PJA34974.1 MAG: hypothetical protein CO186_08340 [Zetaproteobacteria bacterium CG_4_9_14_3_um_filter_49_83]